MSEDLGCKIDIRGETEKVPEPERCPLAGMWGLLQHVISGFTIELWNIVVEDPQKFIHCLKVGLALTIVSLFYYMRPLYDALGGNAMWAVMTVGVVFEYTVGATLYKSINRAIATIIGGSLGIGIQWIAGHCGKEYEPVLTGMSIFIFASIATFSRFIPSVKARFDYGSVVFILTLTFISVSGYRVDKLVMLAEERISTVAIGVSICIIINMLCCPVWAGNQLHHQTIRNLEILANSLEGCVSEYFSKSLTSNTLEKEQAKKLQGYKCLLNSLTAEESMENFARWEPPHGHYHSGRQWKQYLRICEAARNCAYCIDNLNSCINYEIQAPEFLKAHFKEKCTSLSFCSSEVLKELATMVKTRVRSPSMDVAVEEMNLRLEELQNSLLSFSVVSSQNVLPPFMIDSTVEENSDEEENWKKSSILGVLALGCVVTLMIKNVARIKETVVEVDKLATMAEFKIQEGGKHQVKEGSECNEIDRYDQYTIHVLDKV